MNNYIRNRRMLICALFIFTVAAALIIWPAPERRLPYDEPERTDPSPPEHDPLPTAARVISLFRLADLPEVEAPAPSEVKVDPTAIIKAHTLLGVSRNENGAVALISDGARQFSIREGDLVAGFRVVQIIPRQVDFEKDDAAASLRLPEEVSVMASDTDVRTGSKIQ